MANKFNEYLDSFKARLKVDSAVKTNVAQELRTHLEDKSQELRETGLTGEEADRIALESLGPVQLIAQQSYEVYSQGTWQEAFFASLPHLLAALLITSYYWQNIGFLSIILIATTCTVVYGWCHNKPIWLFPWLGYYLLPVIISGILLICLPQGWIWLVTLIYVPLALFTLAYIVKHTAKREWFYVSLMATPLPVILSWFLSLNTGNQFGTNDIWLAQLQPDIPWMAISFVILAIATITFIRVKERYYKTAALLIPPSLIVIVVILAKGGINFWDWPLLFFALFALVYPAYLEFKSG